MNFIIYSIQNKTTGKIEYQGIAFARDTQYVEPNQDLENKERWVKNLGFNPKTYRIIFSQFHGLRKLRKAMWKSIKRAYLGW